MDMVGEGRQRMPIWMELKCSLAVMRNLKRLLFTVFHYRELLRNERKYTRIIPPDEGRDTGARVEVANTDLIATV